MPYFPHVLCKTRRFSTNIVETIVDNLGIVVELSGEKYFFGKSCAQNSLFTEKKLFTLPTIFVHKPVDNFCKDSEQSESLLKYVKTDFSQYEEVRSIGLMPKTIRSDSSHRNQSHKHSPYQSWDYL